MNQENQENQQNYLNKPAETGTPQDQKSHLVKQGEQESPREPEPQEAETKKTMKTSWQQQSRGEQVN